MPQNNSADNESRSRSADGPKLVATHRLVFAELAAAHRNSLPDSPFVRDPQTIPVGRFPPPLTRVGRHDTGSGRTRDRSRTEVRPCELPLAGPVLAGAERSIALPQEESKRSSNVYRSNSEVLIRIQTPPKYALLRLPSDDEVVEFLNSERTLRRNLGRGRPQTITQRNPKADRDLFERLCVQRDTDFDVFEARAALNKLFFTEVTNRERVDDEYVITMKTPLGEVRHTYLAPIVREIQAYRRDVVTSINICGGIEELRTQILVSCAFHDRQIRSIEGYSGEYTPLTVPPHLKGFAVSSLVDFIG